MTVSVLKRIFLLCFCLPVLFAQVAQAQNIPRVYFLAQSIGADSGDPGADVLLYSADLNGIATPISAPEAGSVLTYVVQGTQVAYASRGADDALTLSVTDRVSGATTHTVLQADAVTQLVFSGTQVWAVLQVKDQPPRLEGYDAATLKTINQFTFKVAGTRVTVRDRWALASNAAGGLAILALADLKPLAIDLSGYVAYSAPLWSPTGAQAQFVGATVEHPDDTRIILLDAAAATVSTLDIPDAPASAMLKSFWSDGGHFILTADTAAPDTLVLSPLSGDSRIVISEPGFALTPVSWSADDRWLLYSVQLAGSDTPDLFLYDVEHGRPVPLRLSGVDLIAARWSLTGDTIAVTGRYSGETHFGVFTASGPTFDNWLTQLNTGDATMPLAGLTWIDGASTLALELSGKVYAIDAVLGTLQPLTDSSIVVVPGSVRAG